MAGPMFDYVRLKRSFLKCRKTSLDRVCEMFDPKISRVFGTLKMNDLRSGGK